MPYTTINDICSNRADIRKCSVDTVYKIAKAFHVSMEEILEPYYVYRSDLELFKSNICHKLKEKGDTQFLIDLLESGTIIEYYDRKWYPQALYLLAMLDYVSRENDIPMCSEFDEMRKKKLPNPIFPASVISRCVASGTDSANIDAVIQAASTMKEAINRVGDQNELPKGWLNEDFKKTNSFSPRFIMHSVFYKSFYGGLEVRTITAEYLIAMKLMAGRQYKNDLSDIIGILAEHRKPNKDIYRLSEF